MAVLVLDTHCVDISRFSLRVFVLVAFGCAPPFTVTVKSPSERKLQLLVHPVFDGEER